MRDVGLAESNLKPIVVEESSYTNSIGASSTDPTQPFNQRQREYVVKALSRAAYMQVLAYFWFWTRDPTTCIACCPPGDCPGQDNAYGLLTPDGGRKPSYQAYSHFTSLVSRSEQFVGRLTLPSPKLEGYEFTVYDGRRLQIVWNEADRQSVSYTPSFGTAGAITDPAGATVAPVNGAVAVGAEPRFIFAPACSPRPRVAMGVFPAWARAVAGDVERQRAEHGAEQSPHAASLRRGEQHPDRHSRRANRGNGLLRRKLASGHQHSVLHSARGPGRHVVTGANDRDRWLRTLGDVRGGRARRLPLSAGVRA